MKKATCVEVLTGSNGCVSWLSRSLGPQLRWHPDKNQHRHELATEAFQYLQAAGGRKRPLGLGLGFIRNGCWMILVYHII